MARKPQRKDYWTHGIGGRRIFRQQAFDDAVGTWQRRQDEEQEERRERTRDERIADVDKATNRPEGMLEAGNTTVDGEPGYYEDGGGTGQSGRRERYSGSNGPFGEGHHHDSSSDDGQTWDRWH